MNRIVLIPLAAFAIALAGCGKSNESTQPATASAPAAATTNQPQSAGQALEQYGHTLATAKTTAQRKVDTITVDRAIQAFQADRGQNPQSLDELIKEGFLPKLPELPAGMKYDYDPQKGEVSVAPAQ